MTDAPARQQHVVDQLLDTGVAELPGAIPEHEAGELAAIITELARDEIEQQGARPLDGNGYYVRDLVWKHEAFHRFLAWPLVLPIARTLLGPQVRVDVNARIAFRGIPDAGLAWHIHTPGIVDPPPWYGAPHTLACLVYLDSVTPDEGALRVLPRSHLSPNLTANDAANLERGHAEIELLPQRGDAVLMHGNAWHRTLPTTDQCGVRRLLFVGFGPAWMTLDATVSGQPDRLRRPVADIVWPENARPTPQEADELLGRFRW